MRIKELPVAVLKLIEICAEPAHQHAREHFVQDDCDESSSNRVVLTAKKLSRQGCGSSRIVAGCRRCGHACN